jgi:hypothetical protein
MTFAVFVCCRLGKVRGVIIYGKPEISVIAFGSDDFNIYRLSDALGSCGWNLNALQFPSRSAVASFGLFHLFKLAVHLDGSTVFDFTAPFRALPVRVVCHEGVHVITREEEVLRVVCNAMTVNFIRK